MFRRGGERTLYISYELHDQERFKTPPLPHNPRNKWVKAGVSPLDRRLRTVRGPEKSRRGISRDDAIILTPLQVP